MATQQTFEFFSASTAVGASCAPGAPGAPPTANKIPVNEPPERSPRRSTTAPVAPSRNLPKDSPPVPSSRVAVLDQLRAKMGGVALASPDLAPSSPETFSTGCAELDAWLPGGGLKFDAITEWVTAVPEGGAMTLALIAAATSLRPAEPPRSRSLATTRPSASREPPSAREASTFRDPRRPLVIVDPHGTLHPPALTGLGIDPSRIIWCHAESTSDTVWAIDQSLRCPAVGAVFSVIDHPLDDRDARRLQLAAEQGKTPGMLIRSASTRGRPSFAETRFHVASRHPSRTGARQTERFFQVTLDRCQGGVIGRSLCVSINDHLDLHTISESKHEAAALRLASQLADPATHKPVRRRSVG